MRDQRVAIALTAILEEKNIQKTFLADVSGFSRPSITQWSLGSAVPTVINLIDLASALDFVSAHLGQDFLSRCFDLYISVPNETCLEPRAAFGVVADLYEVDTYTALERIGFARDWAARSRGESSKTTNVFAIADLFQNEAGLEAKASFISLVLGRECSEANFWLEDVAS